jgi:5'-nucleotidase
MSLGRILIANDDGIQSNGLKALERIARTLSNDVWVVAPAAEQSGASHSLTIGRPLRIRRMGDRHFAIDGTPTDTVLMGVVQILKDKKPDLVLSGINRGHNLGEDVTYSGTVAAAMEGTMLGIRSIALSQVLPPDGPTKWEIAETHAPDILRKLAALQWGPNVLMNINFPDLPPKEIQGVAVSVLGRRKVNNVMIERSDPRGRPYYWIDSTRAEVPTDSGTDFAAIHAGMIAITPLYLDPTHTPSLGMLEEAFAK